MTDIFLSYNEKDREQARRVAAMLESVGWTVWWDRRIPAGETWRSVLEQALEDMRCMIVLWSSRSIESEWVYEEATEGRRMGKLVPVLIEAVRPPAGFREIQAADLSNWDGSPEFEGLRMLLADLERLLDKPHPAGSRPVLPEATTAGETGQPYDTSDRAAPVTTKAGWRRPGLAAMAATGVLLVAAIYLALSGRESSMPHRQVSEPERQTVRPGIVAPERTPAPVASEASTAPVAALPPRGRAPVKRAEGVRMTSVHCANLLSRIQLGESLSDEAQAAFQKECQQ